MKIILTDEDIVKLVYNAFVDGGLSELGHSDVEIKFTKSDYAKAKDILKANPQNHDTICYEDVLVQLFKDGKLQFKDHNDDKKYEFTPAFVRSNLDEVVSSDEPNTQAIELIIDSLNEDGDADAFDHWNIMQYMLFKELVYG
jgi:hypothetical protein